MMATTAYAARSPVSLLKIVAGDRPNKPLRTTRGASRAISIRQVKYRQEQKRQKDREHLHQLQQQTTQAVNQDPDKTKKAVTSTQLEQLSTWSVIVEDTSVIGQILMHQPQDATTNPTLVYLATKDEEYKYLVKEAVEFGKKEGGTRKEQVDNAVDMLGCLFGREISQIIPGYVSTEVDARLSFDTEASVQKAHRLRDLYQSLGVDTSRILMKLASTWEMMKVCEILEKEGAKCNMTLVFSLPQAVASADHGATLVSPFVGRIMDWYKKQEVKDSYPASEDPGVQSVKSIYNYFKCHGITTSVMAASFRNKDEILELAGCDRLTIAPKLMEELVASTDPITRKLAPGSPEQCLGVIPDLNNMDEKTFRWMMNCDAMATEKLAEGIRGFTADIQKLELELNREFDLHEHLQ